MGNDVMTEIYVGATTASSGKDVNVRSMEKVIVQIFGTATARTVSFHGSLNRVDFSPLEGVKLGDTTITANNTTGINELWEFDVERLISFRAILGSVSGGTVTIIANSK